MTEQILTAVPYPMTGIVGVALMWGPVCPVHPSFMGSNTPSDADRCCAEAYAEALACGHPDHDDPEPVRRRQILVCTVCADVRSDADVECEGVSKGARCDYLTCEGVYSDPR